MSMPFSSPTAARSPPVVITTATKKRPRRISSNTDNHHTSQSTIDVASESREEKSIETPPRRSPLPASSTSATVNLFNSAFSTVSNTSSATTTAHQLTEVTCIDCPGVASHSVDVRCVAAHRKTIWLRNCLGPLFDCAAKHAKIDWDACVEWYRLPQSGAEVPLVVVDVLSDVVSRANNDKRVDVNLMFLLDAIIRHQNQPSSNNFELAGLSVSIAAILKAVSDSHLLNGTVQVAVRQPSANPQPFERRLHYTHDNNNGERLFSVYTPWQSFTKDYLDR